MGSNDLERMRNLLDRSVELFDYAQSGFISGCGEDLAWEKRKDEYLEDVKDLSKASRTIDRNPETLQLQGTA